MSNDNLIVPRFYIHTVKNSTKSAAAGRPIFDEVEVCEIRMAANKQTVAVYPAHEVWKVVDQPDGSREPTTYAMRFADLYRKFKANEAQTMSGTPLSELPFLSASKRLELKALSVHTAEALAALDGNNLKMLGMGGREMQQQAKAYLDNASGSADATKLAAENVSLRDMIAEQQRQINEMNEAIRSKLAPAPSRQVGDDRGAEDESAIDGSPFVSWDDVDIKNWIESETGAKPRGNPSHATLVRQADEINARLTAAAEQAA